MNGAGGDVEGGRVPPDGSAWVRAQRTLVERNDRARRAGKQERNEHERRLAELHRAAQDGWPDRS
jgi:hypothetical protein